MKDKKILIVGNAFALAKKISDIAEKVYVAPGIDLMSDFAECVDIREDDATGLLKFVLDNEIDLTIATSQKAIKSDIASVFQANDKLIFAPTEKSASFAISKSLGKRFLYKLHVPTPRFGIFEKLPLSLDYLKDASYPLVVRCDMDNETNDRLCCTSFDQARIFAEELFSQGEVKVVIEEYVYGHEFTLYVVTDGYHAVPFASVANFKFTEDGDGGKITSGVGAYVPDYKVPENILSDVFNKVIVPALNVQQKKDTPYVGILGVDVVLTSPDTYTVLEFKPFLKDFDAQAVLNNIDENLIEVFEACANGFFADEYDDILTNDNFSVSCLVRSRLADKVIPNVELADSDISFINTKCNKYFEYISDVGNNFVLTSCAKTLSRAKAKLKEDLGLVLFDGMKYRKDICN